ncbi:hypothetical protein NX773_19525 [Massilia solisilvae]|uniref:Peptidoglycan-binding domain-containing protein n=1 Tax=Massilia solisilvae TaxID=1811225 RepID=A0ABT2BPC5_9BURK|nr:hypothetical protein [Massilia solisilvae]MCS0610361.1 hypothetical protein [Massilia solisilvae]
MTKAGALRLGEQKELSGRAWTGRFPGSNSLRDLKMPFRDSVRAFIDALRSANATVKIAATFRPPERAYLMHWSWRIVKQGFDPSKVPSMPGIEIEWAHNGTDGKYSREASVAAASEMVHGFEIDHLGVAPALASRHTSGFGIDMRISWIGHLSIVDADGDTVEIVHWPHTGLNPTLQEVGASYGVIKYNRSGRDDPHWSDNGA